MKNLERITLTIDRNSSYPKELSRRLIVRKECRRKRHTRLIGDDQLNIRSTRLSVSENSDTIISYVIRITDAQRLPPNGQAYL